jgi:hypothetical protein
MPDWRAIRVSSAGTLMIAQSIGLPISPTL